MVFNIGRVMWRYIVDDLIGLVVEIVCCWLVIGKKMNLEVD